MIVVQERLSRRLAPQDMFGYDAAIKVMDDENMELAAAIWK